MNPPFIVVISDETGVCTIMTCQNRREAEYRKDTVLEWYGDGHTGTIFEYNSEPDAPMDEQYDWTPC